MALPGTFSRATQAHAKTRHAQSQPRMPAAQAVTSHSSPGAKGEGVAQRPRGRRMQARFAAAAQLRPGATQPLATHCRPTGSPSR
eukprot:CAMPEP_0183351178 /NCGR_PEP_ID=MMETSP0164_2-20130417/23408_1 /TAXON_ID=221442 /ORGANISM="Coccolithus pelagicus ssp braarudi, Strain PLY182g" /LENGTH=84 /DNA_ID=CAMNT_0025523289 /DNA_START=521 /DNA_END=775 /DNA_ORIENTATION=+